MSSLTLTREQVAARTGGRTCRAPNPTRARPGQPVLNVVPVTFRPVGVFIAAHHRHHRPPQGMKFTLGVAAKGTVVGVAVVGRPIARHLDDGLTAEVTRTYTDGTPNANSALYAAAWRAARALGYQRLITYTEQGESGASLRAAGFHPTARLAPHHGWDRPGRRRQPSNQQDIVRTRWEVVRLRREPADRPGKHPVPG